VGTQRLTCGQPPSHSPSNQVSPKREDHSRSERVRALSDHLPWDVSTRQTNEGFIRRTIKPALGHIEVRKVRGPILDQLYARLKRCGDLSCTGRPFIEHRNIPVLVIDIRDRRPASQQVADMLAEAIQSGRLAPGDELPSIAELSSSQGIGTGVLRAALEALAADGLILVRHGRNAVIAGEPGSDPRPVRRRPGPGHDGQRAGCRPHVCHLMKASTIRGIHSILSGAFAAAQRWERTERNPAASAKPPTTTRKSRRRCHHAAALRQSGPEVDRRASTYLAQLTSRSAPLSSES